MMKIFRVLKWRHQRLKKGYCDKDVWGMNYYLLTLIPKMLRELRECKHGIPCYTFPEVETFPKGWIKKECEALSKWKVKNGYDNGVVDLNKGKTCNEDPNLDRWWMILSRMIWCFEIANPDFEIKNIYWDEMWNEYYEKNNVENIPKKLEIQFLKQSRRNENFREKCKNEGMDLLKTYLYTLWD